MFIADVKLTLLICLKIIQFPFFIWEVFHDYHSFFSTLYTIFLKKSKPSLVLSSGRSPESPRAVEPKDLPTLDFRKLNLLSLKAVYDVTIPRQYLFSQGRLKLCYRHRTPQYILGNPIYTPGGIKDIQDFQQPAQLQILIYKEMGVT